ncbi:hypothetical protein ACLKMH_19645 [Psychromonas sp. KJ10-10]|uniref:hypothetical protein n=1 Tax=Psychromonas sp. KJ10-10 TaxID=3391823 RepID=UPI0039B501CF
MSVFFLSEDKNEVKNIKAQQIVYQSIGELGGFSNNSNAEDSLSKTINALNDNLDNPDMEKIVNCYTNSQVNVFRDHLKAISYAQGQFCKVQQNLEATSATTQNNSDKCNQPESILLSADELKKLDRQYTGDLQADLASCKN